jgi:PAS domain-containing protein
MRLAASLRAADPRLHRRGRNQQDLSRSNELVFPGLCNTHDLGNPEKEALAVAIADRTAELSTANEDLRRGKVQLDELFELSPDAVILTGEDFNVLRVNKELT